jgi:chromosome partitioning protein
MTRKIVVLNPKGGSGKTTVAINLAAYYASAGLSPTLMDFDPQGSTTRWLKKRLQDQPPIHGIAAYEKNARVTRTFLLRVPAGTQRVIVDTPAAVPAHDMPELVKGADAILVPVLPSDIDIHACSKCISDLLLVAKVRRNEGRIGVVANRVRRNTVVFNTLMRFLATLQIPVITTLRDSQNYVRAAELGYGLHEMKPYLVREDTDSWQPLIDWLESRPPLGSAVPGGAGIAGASGVTGVAGVPSAGLPGGGLAGTAGAPSLSPAAGTGGVAGPIVTPLGAAL